MITTIEELSLNAWASLQTVLYDGWVLRFANGYTKRANSVNPIHPSSLDIEEKIRFCENLYQDRNLPVVFKLTPTVYPSDLDEKLAANGYRKESSTSVQIMDLIAAGIQVDDQLDLRESLPDEWLDAVCRMSSAAEKNQGTLRAILSNIVPRHCFVSLRYGSEIVACGMGVLQSEYVGLFDIVTDPAFRGRGYARQVVNGILAWGKQNKAQRAYLQVEIGNTPAQHLYTNLGFTENYQYWYRVKP